MALLVAAAMAVAPTAALASETMESVFQDDDALLHSTPDQVAATVAELRDLGVERLRLSVIWRNLAPPEPPPDPGDPAAYPAEQFDPLDHAIRTARAHGLEVLLNVRGGAPAWAMPAAPGRLAGRDGYVPSPGDFRGFTAMLGRRFDGTYADENHGGRPLPRATAWSIWNEPNWGGHLQPQSVRDPERGLVTVAPRHYRRLFRAAVQALVATGHGAETILLGETAPIGNAKLGELSHLRPVRFLRDLFCLNRRLEPVRRRAYVRRRCDFDTRGPLPATGFAHHPYPVTAPPGRPSADRRFLTFGDTPRLKRILDAAARAKRIAPGLPIWFTEFGYQTAPPDPFRGVTLEQQARYLVEAEYLAWADPRVVALTQFLLRDDEPRALYPEGDPRRWATYQSGLRFGDGTPKPAYDAYRLPMRAPRRIRPGRALDLWGMVRPGVNGQAQRVRIEHRADGAETWTAVAETTATTPKGHFVARVDRPRAGTYRFVWLQPGNPAQPPATPSPQTEVLLDRLRPP